MLLRVPGKSRAVMFSRSGATTLSTVRNAAARAGTFRPARMSRLAARQKLTADTFRSAHRISDVPTRPLPNSHRQPLFLSYRRFLVCRKPAQGLSSSPAAAPGLSQRLKKTMVQFGPAAVATYTCVWAGTYAAIFFAIRNGMDIGGWLQPSALEPGAPAGGGPTEELAGEEWRDSLERGEWVVVAETGRAGRVDVSLSGHVTVVYADTAERSRAISAARLRRPTPDELRQLSPESVSFSDRLEHWQEQLPAWVDPALVAELVLAWGVCATTGPLRAGATVALTPAAARIFGRRR